MANTKVEIQRLLLSKLKEEAYPVVAYDTDDLPYLTGELLKPEKPYINEVSASLETTDNSKYSGRLFSQKDWAFEGLVKFTKEVDASDFLSSAFKQMKATLNSGTAEEIYVEVDSAAFTVEHPVMRGKHTGSQYNINIIVTTRR